MALMIKAKLSSIRMMSGASFATSVPVVPVENPTLVILRAGPSFIPSPVMLMISPREQRVSTRIFILFLHLNNLPGRPRPRLDCPEIARCVAHIYPGDQTCKSNQVRALSDHHLAHTSGEDDKAIHTLVPSSLPQGDDCTVYEARDRQTRSVPTLEENENVFILEVTPSVVGGGETRHGKKS